MIVYITVGILLLIAIYIVILYCKNSKKIKKAEELKNAKMPKDKNSVASSGEEVKKEDKVQTKANNVEVQSQIIKGTMFEEAIKEAEKSGYSYKTNNDVGVQRKDTSRLKVDRENYVSEIEKNMGSSISQRHISSETNKIGHEGPTTLTVQKDEIEKKSDEVSNDIKNLSNELKALLVNDVLNRKY